MGLPEAIVILLLLLLGPLAARRIEENLEAYCFLLGLLATALAGGADRAVIAKALADPLPISL
ncbi:MAG: DUF1646 family protein, partial [Candidatus Binataceae bacterium]